MVWLGKDLKAYLIPSPYHGQGHLSLSPFTTEKDTRDTVKEAEREEAQK